MGSKKPELGHDQTGASAPGAVGEQGPRAPDEIAMPGNRVWGLTRKQSQFGEAGAG